MLEGKIALVTGGSRGIGEGIVRKLISLGASVAFTYRSSADRATAIIDDLGVGDRLTAFQSDAADYAQAEELIKNVLERFGKIDILVNNAGITKDGLMLRMSEEQWDNVIEINLKSVFNITKHALRPMMKNRGGSIINLTSVVGVFGNAGQANYAASKAGIIGFTKSIAKEVGSRNIRCNAIAPGFIATEMTENLDDKTREAYLNNVPLKRFGTAEEVAELVAYIGSDAAAYMTGQVLSVCGGLNV